MIVMKDFNNEIPKHKKKKESSTSKSDRKSKHKHEYIDCLLIDENMKHPYKSEYCKICGKIGNVSFFGTRRDEETGYMIMLSDEEMFEKYKHLEQFRVGSVFRDKYVSIVKESE